MLNSHEHLRGLLARVFDAMAFNARDDVSALWGELEHRLLAHMEAEERFVLLIMLPIVASIGFFVGGARLDGSLPSAFAATAFVALAAGVLAGALRIVRTSERVER